LHFAAALQLFGIAAFHVLLVPRALRPVLDRPFRVIAISSAILALSSAIAWLLAAAGTMGSGPADMVNPDVLGAVLFQTGFGRVWGPRLIGCVLAVGVAFVAGEAAWWAALVLATLVLGSLGLVGHAAIDSGLLGLLNQTSQVLHVLSSGFWLGALLPLLFVLVLFRNPAREPMADETLRRFSGFGHTAVAILLLSGVANTWFILGQRVDFAVPYVQLLLIKVALAGTMCVLAIVNRYAFMPRIPHGGPGARLLSHGTVAEIVLGALIIALVSALGILAPA
jgi:putative copper resistance protein D